MKVYTIEIAEAIEKEFAAFLKDWGGGYQMRFTRFIDLGGKQIDLYLYPPESNAPPWMVIRVKSVFKSDQGECMQYFVNIPSLNKSMDDVLVSPEVWKIPALTDRILQSVKNDMLAKISESGGGAIEGGDSGSLPEPTPDLPSGSQEADNSDDEEELEDMDVSGILASDDDEADNTINPEEILKSVEKEESGEVSNDPPSEDEETKKRSGEASEGESGFNHEDVIKD